MRGVKASAQLPMRKGCEACMSESETTQPIPPGELLSRYRVYLLADAKPTERGIVYRRGEQRFLLAWGRLGRGFCAEVGEPQGVCTIVFDLVAEIVAGECVVFRFDAEPGHHAHAVGCAIEIGIGHDRCDSSLRAVATDGYATRNYPDLDTFEEANLEALRFKPLEAS
jgi:hypothetical protein